MFSGSCIDDALPLVDMLNFYKVLHLISRDDHNRILHYSRIILNSTFPLHILRRYYLEEQNGRKSVQYMEASSKIRVAGPGVRVAMEKVGPLACQIGILTQLGNGEEHESLWGAIIGTSKRFSKPSRFYDTCTYSNINIILGYA